LPSAYRQTAQAGCLSFPLRAFPAFPCSVPGRQQPVVPRRYSSTKLLGKQLPLPHQTPALPLPVAAPRVGRATLPRSRELLRAFAPVECTEAEALHSPYLSTWRGQKTAIVQPPTTAVCPCGPCCPTLLLTQAAWEIHQAQLKLLTEPSQGAGDCGMCQGEGRSMAPLIG